MGVVLQRQRDETEKPDPEQAVPSGRRVLFVIRDKLGDSLLAFATVQQYLKLRPGDDVTVLMRKDYAELVAGEDGFRLVRYRGGTQAMLWAGMQRVLARPYDALVVLRGFGDRVRKLGALVPARRRISFSGKLAPTFSEWPPAFESEDWSLVEPSFRAAAVLEPGLAVPQRLELSSLRPPAAVQGKRFVGVCPITDEKRKDMSQASLDPLLDHIARTHLGVPIKVLVRDGAETLFDLGGRSACELVNFRDLTRLRELFGSMAAYYGADTGLYHLAAAMGVPATVVFGPTQPGRIILPRQEAASVRLEVLAESHCEVKSCRDPACIEQACANLVSGDTVVALDRTPADCPLRRWPPEARRINRWHRYPLTVEASPAPQAR
jgi:ADP-heptose:LPS heptosyltransferase